MTRKIDQFVELVQSRLSRTQLLLQVIIDTTRLCSATAKSIDEIQRKGNTNRTMGFIHKWACYVIADLYALGIDVSDPNSPEARIYLKERISKFRESRIDKPVADMDDATAIAVAAFNMNSNPMIPAIHEDFECD